MYAHGRSPSYGATANDAIGCATYYMVWPEDGKLKKEDIRRLYDGSLFYDLADRRKKSKTWAADQKADEMA